MNIILFGGCFDPVHIGHVNMALRAAEKYDAKVIFIPSPIGVWKNESASKKDKLAMLELAIKPYKNFSIDEFELNTGKDINYSIYTVRHFKEVYPTDNLYFLIGADQVNKFHLWNGAKEISELVNIIYYPREGHFVEEDNVKKFNMEMIEGVPFESSSTDIRDLSKLSVKQEVLNYIIEHDLYFVKKVKSFYSPKRYEHALSVARLAVDVAKANGMDFDFLLGYIFTSAYLHDIGKDIPKEEQDAIMMECYPQFINMPRFSYHQFVGAEIARREFGINDIFILDGIRYHATGRAYMTNLEKIIYACDKIDPLRGYDSTKLIDSMKNDFSKGFVEVLKANKEYLLEQGKSISNPLSDECFNLYLKDNLHNDDNCCDGHHHQ